MTPRTPGGDPSAPGPSHATPLVVNGWRFLMWPHFDVRWTNLLRAVLGFPEGGRPRTGGAGAGPEAIVLKAIIRVIRDQIARDPNDRTFHLRGELSAWRRVHFLGRLRLFYRFSSAHRIVVLTWLNDEHTLRKEGASSDPYVVFSGMLRRGEVPASWEDLVAGARPLPAPLPESPR